MYAAPVWSLPPSLSSHQMELLRSFKRMCLRHATNIKRKRTSFKHVKIKNIYEQANCIKIDQFAVQRHINFYGKCRGSLIKKFRFPNIRIKSKMNYPHIGHIYSSHKKGQLLVNGRLELFHRKYNGRSGLVYRCD